MSNCATTRMRYNPNDCVLSDSGNYYTCYYIKDGKVHTYKKSANKTKE